MKRELKPKPGECIKEASFGHHINDLQDKTAFNIDCRRLQKDKEHAFIAAAAALLVIKGQGSLTYGGQYQHGATIWLDTNCRTVVIREWEPAAYKSSASLFPMGAL
jgi:hypothetical protein